MAKPTNKRDPLTVAEMISFEAQTRKSIETFFQEEGEPRIQEIAILGHIKAKRENPALDFGDYVENTPLSEIVKDAVGSDDDEDEKKDGKSSTTQQRGKRISAEPQD